MFPDIVDGHQSFGENSWKFTIFSSASTLNPSFLLGESGESIGRFSMVNPSRPRGTDRSTQERWSARTGADIWSSSGGSWRTSCRAWPRQSWWRKFCAATKMEGWYGWQCWAFCPWESPGEHQNSWYNDDKWVWVNTYRYITIVGWTSILTQLWLGVH